MGFPMTVERVLARNGIDPSSTLADDVRRLAADATTIEHDRAVSACAIAVLRERNRGRELRSAAEAALRAWRGVESWSLEEESDAMSALGDVLAATR
jgi:D-aminopeptidase